MDVAPGSNGRYENSKTNSSIQTEREKRPWGTKEAMDILKPVEAISLIREMKKKKKKKKKKKNLVVNTVDLPFHRKSRDSSAI
jgi:hypothetical protein